MSASARSNLSSTSVRCLHNVSLTLSTAEATSNEFNRTMHTSVSMVFGRASRTSSVAGTLRISCRSESPGHTWPSSSCTPCMPDRQMQRPCSPETDPPVERPPAHCHPDCPMTTSLFRPIGTPNLLMGTLQGARDRGPDLGSEHSMFAGRRNMGWVSRSGRLRSVLEGVHGTSLRRRRMRRSEVGCVGEVRCGSDEFGG